MSPVEQDVVRQFTDSMTAFRELGLALAVLFVVFIGLVTVCLFIVFNYRLRTTMAHRDEARATVDAAESTRQDELLGKIVDMYSSFAAAIKETKEDMATAIFASNQQLGKVTEVLKEVSTTNKALESVVATHNSSVATLQDTTQQIADAINTTTLNLEALNKNVEAMKNETKRVYDRLAKLFPREELFDDEIEQIIIEAVKKGCAEKRATDEKPAVTLPPPDIQPAPDQQSKAG